MSADRIRLDKWLWYARQAKTRSKASKLIEEGKVRVNREKVSKPAQTIRPGDTITAMIGGRPRVLEVLALGSRRGPASEAMELYNDLSPVIASAPHQADITPRVPQREPGSGRPTKRERRQTDRLRHRALYDGNEE